MRRLATDIWTKKPETRIHWCRNVCLDYFLNGGLEKLRQKDERRLAYETLRIAEKQTSNVYDGSKKLLESAQDSTLSKQQVNGHHESSHSLHEREDGLAQSASPVEISRIAEDCRPLQFDSILFDGEVGNSQEGNSSFDACTSNYMGEVTTKKSDNQCM